MTIKTWESKLKSFVPSWTYRGAGRVRMNAVYSGMAAMLAAMEQDISDVFGQTFIEQAVGQYLAQHGFDRNKVRQNGESDAAFRQRIRTISSSAGCVPLHLIVNATLERGPAKIVEQDSLRTFLNGQFFVGNNFFISGNAYHNHFIVIVPRGNSDTVLNSIISTVNQDRAFGTAWTMIMEV